MGHINLEADDLIYGMFDDGDFLQMADDRYDHASEDIPIQYAQDQAAAYWGSRFKRSRGP